MLQTATVRALVLVLGVTSWAQTTASHGGPSIPAGGCSVAFESGAGNLLPGNAHESWDDFAGEHRVGSPFAPFCPGDGSSAFCPCFNHGIPGHGCENSSTTGGALLTASGIPSLSADTVQLTSSDERPGALSIVLQSDLTNLPVTYGDGIFCMWGNLKLLYVKHAVGGVVVAPRGVEPSISARSAALGDPIPPGARRNYQVYYRDPSTTFCPSPSGDTFNVSGAMAIIWGS